MSGPADVVARHVAAVAGGDPAAMAADYAPGAVLLRGDDRYEGQPAIRRYFDGLARRLAGGTVQFGEPVADGDVVRFSWRIAGGPAGGTAGTDTCVVRDGAIVEQRVALDGADF